MHLLFAVYNSTLLALFSNEVGFGSRGPDAQGIVMPKKLFISNHVFLTQYFFFCVFFKKIIFYAINRVVHCFNTSITYGNIIKGYMQSKLWSKVKSYH